MTSIAQDALETTSISCAPFSVEAIRILDTLALPAHTHDGRHLMIVTEGAIVEASRDPARVATAGSARFSPDSELHTLQVVEAPFSCILVSLRANVRASFPDHGLLTRDATLAAKARGIAAQPIGRSAGDLVTMTARVWELLAQWNQVARHADVLHTPSWLTDVCEKVQSDFAAPLRAHALARQAGVHPAHLSRAFRMHLGRTLRDYVRECRLQAAVRMLECSTATISAIAATTGFSDHAHLTRVVRCYTRLTPTAVRLAAQCKTHSSVDDGVSGILLE